MNRFSIAGTEKEIVDTCNSRLLEQKKEEQKRSLINSRCNEYVINKIRELQV